MTSTPSSLLVIDVGTSGLRAAVVRPDGEVDALHHVELPPSSPFPGLVEFDAAGQEFRWMAVEANDPTMIKLCQPGEDAHSFMGAKIDGQPYEHFDADRLFVTLPDVNYQVRVVVTLVPTEA